jgi:hypothetical protein
MRFRLRLEELKSDVEIALENADLFADLKDAKMELRLSKAGPPRVNYEWKNRSLIQRIAWWLFGILIPIVYVTICAYFLYIPSTPLFVKLVQFILFSITLAVIVNSSFMDPRIKSKEGTFLLIMPSTSFLYLLPFHMEKSLLHELQHVRQGFRGWVPSEKEANKKAKELLPTFLAKIKERRT